MLRLQLWDTAGQPQFRPLAPMYFGSAHLTCVTFSLDSMQSFQSAHRWFTQILKASPHQPILLIGTKSESMQRRVSDEVIAQYLLSVKGICRGYCEVSAKAGTGIDSLLFSVATILSQE
eukprot:CAMPEP_0177664478 /NCGR_PEP_ID=MMETSP0447-20121125/20516_1 /TAXON_ID=0 /ORGANISM="Stygamoeba regulata, Strain BSH-02190019" /LENGTH=118 /DNA_ID=CAMNT_0019170455 /DNA_START=42 /DNA_END=395 /DNA_ORIENTATION=+